MECHRPLSFNVCFYLYTVHHNVIMVADDGTDGFEPAGCDVVRGDTDYGIFELNEELRSGTLRIGTHKTLIVMLGRADVVQGRRWLKATHRLLDTCSTFGLDTLVILGGPVPMAGDGKHLLELMSDFRCSLRAIAEEHPGVMVLRTVEHFTDHRGIRREFVNHDGLTELAKGSLQEDLDLLLR